MYVRACGRVCVVCVCVSAWIANLEGAGPGRGIFEITVVKRDRYAIKMSIVNLLWWSIVTLGKRLRAPGRRVLRTDGVEYSWVNNDLINK